MKALVIVGFGVGVAGTAAADPTDDIVPVAHVTAGSEFEFGRHDSSGARLTGIGGVRLGDNRLDVGVGITFASTTLYVKDPRALDGDLRIDTFTVGPIGRIGYDFHSGLQLFATGAILSATYDPRLAFDPVPAVVQDPLGARATIGVNASRAIAKWARSGEAKHHHELAWTLLGLPHQLEVTWEHDAGSDRIGFGTSWGI